MELIQVLGGLYAILKYQKKETRTTIQHNLLISHAVGVGNPIKKEISKTMLLAKSAMLYRKDFRV